MLVHLVTAEPRTVARGSTRINDRRPEIRAAPSGSSAMSTKHVKKLAESLQAFAFDQVVVG